MTDSPLIGALAARGITVVSDGGMTARLEFPGEAVGKAYRQITLPGAGAGVSFYFLDHWLEAVCPKHFAVYARLRALARLGFHARATLAELAASITLGEDAVRQFIRWWETPQPGDLEWGVLRAYVRHIGAGRGQPYTFQVLADDVLHPRDAERLDAILATGIQTAGGTGAGATSGIETGEAGRAAGGPVSRRLPPAPPSHGHGPSPCLAGHGPSTRAGDPEAAAALLRRRGVPEAAIRRALASHPEAAFWAERWGEWVRAKQPKDATAFLLSMIRAACAGNPEAREEPWAYTRQREREERDGERSRARVNHTVQAAPAPRPALPIGPAVEPDAAHLWEALRRAADPLVRGLLESARAVRLEGGALLIEAPPASVELLVARRRKLLERVREVEGEFLEVGFVVGGGKGLS